MKSPHSFQQLLHSRGHSIIEVINQHPSIKAMVRTGIEGLWVPFLTLIEFLIFLGCKGVNLPLQIIGFMDAEEFLQNSACISAQFIMVLGLRELSHILALSFKVRGKNFSLIRSTLELSSLKVLHTSLNSRMCEYGFSLSIPWKVGSRGTM